MGCPRDRKWTENNDYISDELNPVNPGKLIHAAWIHPMDHADFHADFNTNSGFVKYRAINLLLKS